MMLRAASLAAMLLGATLLGGLAGQQARLTYAAVTDTGQSDGNTFTADANFGEDCDDPGPDGFGYTCRRLGYAFEDIVGTGTTVTLTDDQVSGAISLGFTFPYYTQNPTTVRISSNGFLSFVNTVSGCCSGVLIPNPNLPNNMVAGYWEDLNPPAGGSIKFERRGVAPERRFIVQFTDVPHFVNTNAVTFQMVLNETGRIYLVYEDAPSDGGTHSAGIENATGTGGLSLRFGSFSLVSRRYVFTPPGLSFATPGMAADGLSPEAGLDGEEPEQVPPPEPPEIIPLDQKLAANQGGGKGAE